MLEELGIPYENIPAQPQGRAVRKYHETGKIPLLLELNQDDEVVFQLYESVAINNYLGSKYNSPLVPTGTQRALYDQIVCCILSELDAQALWIHRKHAHMPQYFGEAPGAVVEAKMQFDRINSSLVKQLNPYLLGETFTAADILYVACLDWSKSIGWNDNWPDTVSPYRRLCHERPAFQRASDLRRQEMKRLEEKKSKL